MLKRLAMFLGTLAVTSATADANTIIEEKLNNILDKNDLLLKK